jgi:hypothetical protein
MSKGTFGPKSSSESSGISQVTSYQICAWEERKGLIKSCRGIFHFEETHLTINENVLYIDFRRAILGAPDVLHPVGALSRGIVEASQ